VNPCGFALLPAYLARRLGSGEESQRVSDAVARALLVGGVTAVGFLLVFGTLGTAISAGAHELTNALPWAGLVIGVGLALAGAMVLAGRRITLRLPRARARAFEGGLRGDLLFGIGYGTASLSCTLPIFLAATGTAVTGSVAGSVLGFAAYATGMGTILTALAVAAALSRGGIALALRRVLPQVNRLSGALLLLAGVYVVYYWGFFLLPGSDTRTSGRSLIDRGGQLSGRLATWLGSSTGHEVIWSLLGLTALLATWAVWRRLRRRRGDDLLVAGRSPSPTSAVDEGRTREPASSQA
jgi:cytochrome c-type biogenesis protein